MCPHCRAFITTKDRVCPYCHEPVGPRAIDVRNPADLLGGLIPGGRFTTSMLLLINCAVYVATVIYSMGLGNGSALMTLDLRTLYQFGAKFRREILLGGEWWRVVTAGFLHGGLLHIGMNMWAMLQLGPQVEEMYGSSRYLTIYLASGAGGFALSTMWSAAPSVGASASLFGLIGAMIALGVRSKGAMGAAIRGLYIRFAIGGLLFGFLPYFHIDNAAHMGGLATGFLVGYVADTPKLTNTPGERVWRAAAWATALGTAYCFVKMYLAFSSQVP